MKEKIEVYESLRNEIISMEELQRNVWLYMYILFCTLFVLGLQWSHNLFLVSYIILIPFQCIINNYWWLICKVSIYIKIFFEDESKDISWESLHFYEKFLIYEKEKRRSLGHIIGTSSSIHLGALATGFYCGYTLKDLYFENHFLLGIENIILIIVSIILLMLLIMLNISSKKNYDPKLENIMKNYKRDRIQL